MVTILIGFLSVLQVCKLSTKGMLEELSGLGGKESCEWVFDEGCFQLIRNSRSGQVLDRIGAILPAP